MFDLYPRIEKVRAHVCNYDVTAQTARNPKYITVTIRGNDHGIDWERSFSIVNEESAREIIERRLGWLVTDLMRRY